MDIIITALGELVWASSCALVNFCLTSGLSVLAVFVSFLCAILASAFYKYSANHPQLPFDDSTCALINHVDEDLDKSDTITSTTEQTIESSLPLITTDKANNTTNIGSLSDIDICLEKNTDEHEVDSEQTSNMFIDSIEGSEEEIQKQQITNIYRLLNDQNLANNWTTTDFLDQLKMYGFQSYEENELELS
ncbi:unnamed protein product [Rotaria socialis]|uniref:Uncharacterized protein n=1 Tax=Rotaria socialis TaxID=392032 RepID=A0A818UBS1_9BILA|nr:unnamed protein product [Rotaria socialis]CAF4469781.1 unnamed protein product [Rotaria socialis]